jgi:hypothetical protein
MTTTLELDRPTAARRVPTGIKQAGRLESVFDQNSWRRWPPCVFGLLIDGDLDVSLIQRALTCVARRHASLRTYFPDHGAVDHGVCLAAETIEWPVEVIDLRELTGPALAAAQTRSQLALQEYFDPTRTPLIRAQLLRFGDKRWQLGLAVDHLVFDGSSIAVLFDELELVYRELRRGGDESRLAVEISDFSAFCAEERQVLRGPLALNALEYWRPIWDGVGPYPPAGLPMLAEAPNPDARPTGAIWSRKLPLAALEAARSGSACGYVSPFTQAASAVLFALGEMTGRADRALLYTSSRRFTAQATEMIGDLTDKCLLRVHAEPGLGFDEHTALVRDAVLDAADHAETPFEFLRETLLPNRADHRPKGPFIILNVDSPPSAPRLDGLSVRTAWPIDADVFSECTWLAVELERTDAEWVTLSCGFQSTLFDERVIDQFMTRVAASLIRI